MFEEHLINLLKGAVGCFRLVEKDVNPAEDGTTAKNEGSFGTQISFIGVEDVGKHELPHSLKALLHDTGDGDGLGSEARYVI